VRTLWKKTITIKKYTSYTMILSRGSANAYSTLWWPRSEGHHTVRWVAPDCPVLQVIVGSRPTCLLVIGRLAHWIVRRSVRTIRWFIAYAADFTPEQPFGRTVHRTVRCTPDCPVGGIGPSGATHSSPTFSFLFRIFFAPFGLTS
jgi:hypothetical protein